MHHAFSVAQLRETAEAHNVALAIVLSNSLRGDLVPLLETHSRFADPDLATLATTVRRVVGGTRVVKV